MTTLDLQKAHTIGLKIAKDINTPLTHKNGRAHWAKDGISSNEAKVSLILDMPPQTNKKISRVRSCVMQDNIAGSSKCLLRISDLYALIKVFKMDRGMHKVI